MNLRQKINENRRGSVIIGGSLIVAAVLLGVLRLVFGSSGESSKAFFTIDDGKTWFVDSATKIAPFEHEGKTAYQAHVFSCNNGETEFVLFLQRFSPEQKRTIESYHENPKQSIGALLQADRESEVKKPGEPDWISGSDERAMEIRTPRCPDGSTTGIVRVVP